MSYLEELLPEFRKKGLKMFFNKKKKVINIEKDTILEEIIIFRGIAKQTTVKKTTLLSSDGKEKVLNEEKNIFVNHEYNKLLEKLERLKNNTWDKKLADDIITQIKNYGACEGVYK